MIVRNDFKWNDHVEAITTEASKRLFLLKQLKRAGIKHKDLVLFYCNVIRSILEYSCQLFHQSLPNYLSDEIERIQRRAMRIVYPDLKYGEALAKADITTLHSRRKLLSRKLFNDIANDKNHKLAELLPPKSSHNKSLRNKRLFNTPICKTDRFKKSFIISHSMYTAEAKKTETM